jgi:hypothetical protein
MPWGAVGWGLALLFFALAVVRAALVPLTYDEAASYLRYIVSDPLSAFNFAVATNHLLNTLLTKAAYLVAGGHELVLRLPNLLAYAAYLSFSLLIARRVTDKAVALAGFLLLNLNPYVLDFFSLSRGYGLSLALLLGMFYFLLRSVPLLTADGGGGPDLTRALVLGGAATWANFTLVNVFIAVLVLLFCAFALSNKLSRSARAPESPRPGPAGRASAWRWLFAGVFMLLVFSQDAGLSSRLYEPVLVRLPGLTEAELGLVEVSRLDVRGRRKPVERRDHEWQLDEPVQVTGLLIELPTDLARRVEVVDVMVGNRSFRHRRFEDVWQVRDVGGTRIMESGPTLSLPRTRVPAFNSIINWRGDAVYLATLARCTAIGLLLLAALALLLKGFGWLMLRARLQTAAQWRLLSSATLWLAALVGAPLYLLKRESELYFGGTGGLVQDTYYSLIDGSFYFVTYLGAQVPIVLSLVLISVAAGAAVTYVSWRRGACERLVPALGILGVLALVSISEIVQRFIFGTPYLLSRMALFFIPLYVLYLVFLADAAATLGRTARALVLGALSAVLCASVYHFATTFNVTRAREWPEDACTKGMIDDLGWILGSEAGRKPEAELAVEWMYYPVAVVYADRVRQGLVHVSVGTRDGADFFYVLEKNRPAALNVIKKYPTCGTVLVKGNRRS